MGKAVAEWGWGFYSAPPMFQNGLGKPGLSPLSYFMEAVRNSVMPSERGRHLGPRVWFWSKLWDFFCSCVWTLIFYLQNGRSWIE